MFTAQQKFLLFLLFLILFFFSVAHSNWNIFYVNIFTVQRGMEGEEALKCAQLSDGTRCLPGCFALSSSHTSFQPSLSLFSAATPACLIIVWQLEVPLLVVAAPLCLLLFYALHSMPVTNFKWTWRRRWRRRRTRESRSKNNNEH